MDENSKIIEDCGDYVIIEDTINHVVIIDAPPFMSEKTKEHAKATVQKWAEYFEYIKNKPKSDNNESDWEPLHIGFRDDE